MSFLFIPDEISQDTPLIFSRRADGRIGPFVFGGAEDFQGGKLLLGYRRPRDRQ